MQSVTKNHILLSGELVLNQKRAKRKEGSIDYSSTMVSRPKKSQIQIRSIKFQSKKDDESMDRHFNSTGADIFGKSKTEDKVEMYVHQVEKGRTRLKMPTAQGQRPRRRPSRETQESLPKYEMHQGPEPQDFMQRTQPSFFDNLMGIQRESRQHDLVQPMRSEQDVEGCRGHFSLYKNNPILEETEIREQYRFKLPVLMNTLENDNNYLHFNEGFLQSCEFIESIIRNVKQEFAKVKEQKEQLQREIKAMQTEAPKAIEEVARLLPLKIPGYYSILKENFVQQQNENFITQKTIVLLKRDNNSFHSEIEKALLKIRMLEGKLFGFQFFELQTQDEMLNSIPQMNLRKDVMKITTQHSKQKQYQYIIH